MNKGDPCNCTEPCCVNLKCTGSTHPQSTSLFHLDSNFTCSTYKPLIKDIGCKNHVDALEFRISNQELKINTLQMENERLKQHIDLFLRQLESKTCTIELFSKELEKQGDINEDLNNTIREFKHPITNSHERLDI